MKKIIQPKVFCSILLAILVAFAMTSLCSAQEWSRKGKKGEVFIFGQSMSGDTTTGLGIKIELDDNIAGGFGFGSHLSDNLSFNWDTFFGSKNVTGTATINKKIVKVKGDTSLLGINLNLDFNLLKERFTPLITGGIGFINFSGDVKGFPFDETDLSYNLGGGFRWDATDHLLIKAIYRATWTKLEDTDKSVQFDGIALSVGYIF